MRGCERRRPPNRSKVLYSVFLLECLLLLPSETDASLSSNLQRPDANFLQTARSVISHLEIDFPVAVILDSRETGRPELNTIVSYLHAGHSVSVRVIKKTENSVNVGFAAGAYVFFQARCDVRLFNSTFAATLSDRDWSPLSKTLVLTASDCAEDQLEGVFWTLGAADALGACVVSSGGRVTTYDPLECGPRASRGAGRCARPLLLESPGAGRRLFPGLSGGLRGARLTAAITPFGSRVQRAPGGGFQGLDVDVVQMLCSVLNATLELREPRDGAGFGFRRADGSYTGLSGEVASGSVDFAANLRYFKPQALHLIGYTRVFSKDDLCVVVAKAGLLPAHLQLVRPFCASTWVAAAATLLAGGLVWRVVTTQPRHQVAGGRSRPRPRPRRPACAALLEACSPCVGVALHRPPPRPAPRLFLAAWLPAALVLSTAFQGQMTGSLAVVRWLRDPERLEEVPGPYYVTASQLAFLSTQPRDALSRMLAQGLLISDVHETARRIASEGKGALLLDRWEADRVAGSSEHASPLGLPRLHVVRNCPYRSYVAYEVPRRSALRPRVDRVLARALAAGIPQHWRASARHAQLVRGQLLAPVREPPPRPLRPQHLEVACGLLALGCGAAAAAFLAEVAAGACRVARQRRRRPRVKVFTV